MEQLSGGQVTPAAGMLTVAVDTAAAVGSIRALEQAGLGCELAAAATA